MRRRRLISISLVAFITLLLYGLIPVLLVIAYALSISPRFRTLPHALFFALGFLFYECVGIVRLFTTWLLHRHGDDYMARNQKIQYWWAGGLLRLGIRIFHLNIQVTGQDAIAGPSALVIPRHTSIADTVLPMLYFAEHRHEGMRYVLKKELMVMPCLDIAGHRLPNLFVDRSGSDTPRELEAIAALTRQASAQENVLVFPEGTRATEDKRNRLAEQKPELPEQLNRWPNLLPPRLGGVGAMLQANPGKDVVFLAHTGFEGSASPRDLVNGSWRHQTVRLHFWRIAYADIPSDHRAFVLEHWDQMQQHVAQMDSAPS